MDTVLLVLSGAFLLGLIGLDLVMIVPLLRQGDERKQLIVWKASTYTLLGAVGGLVLDIVEALVQVQAMVVNPFVKLGSIAILYCVLLLIFKKKYGD